MVGGEVGSGVWERAVTTEPLTGDVPAPTRACAVVAWDARRGGGEGVPGDGEGVALPQS
jgi:hypothetical protein